MYRISIARKTYETSHYAYATLEVMVRKSTSSGGFTIVELLIVVVVIAVLAAITIVAFQGITQRAEQSSAASQAAQAQRKLTVDFIQAGELYPTVQDFATQTGLVSNQTTSYEYSVSADRKEFCLTATSSGISYRTTHETSNVVAGACPGHAANGVAAITNLIPNPSFEVNANNAQNIGNATGRSVTRIALGDAHSGDHVLRITQPTSGVNMGGYGVNTGDPVPTGAYNGSIWIRSNQSVSVTIYLEGSAAKSPGSGGGGTLVPNQWRRLNLPFTVTAAGTVKLGYLTHSSSPAANTFIDIDGVMLTAGSQLHTYADGSSANWVWTASPHASTSLGVPLP